ncbi:hypothetical protein [Sansalvadorimonas verongulae]|uniref:hypothetical protein n=1 Tax=Sansalvadorimonas verongulae TaxID=2172824 RepID=UPI0012BD81BE|nr:hypothetical protein [Sansalvadorimonas verongulae]
MAIQQYRLAIVRSARTTSTVTITRTSHSTAQAIAARIGAVIVLRKPAGRA